MKVIARKVTIGVVAAAAVFAVGAPIVHAQSAANSRLQQQINPGVISTSIRDGSNAVVASPSFSMANGTVSTSAQTVTGTFGSASQRITVDNPGGANDGWTLALNATVPGTSTWTSGANNYPYNGTSSTGQLTVNPAAGTLTAVRGGNTGVTLSAQQSFTGTNPVTLAVAAAASADIWNGYITGIGLSQVIPAATPAGAYTLDLTQTVTAG